MATATASRSDFSTAEPTATRATRYARILDALHEADPIPADLVPAVCVLLDHYYEREAIARIVAHVGLHGTTACCCWFDCQEHMDEVEATLPNSLLWQSSEWDSCRWTLCPVA